MKLTLNQIKQLVHGAVEVCRDDDGLIRLYRMLPYQRNIYIPKGDLFYKRSCNPSGTKIVMETDSPHLTLDLNISHCTTREFFGIDVYINDTYADSLECYGHDKMFGDHRKTFDLGEGYKAVSIYMPWSVQCGIRDIELDDGSQVTALPRKKKLLMFGDSITQGFDSVHPSKCYASQIADWLNAECINKAIGADVFDPDIVEQREPFEPDYIIVAYGTNDWSRTTQETFVQNCNLFLSRLSTHYPTAKLFVLAPIWRQAWQETRVFGQFRDVSKELECACRKLPNGIFIDCFDFIPPEAKYFKDQVLHPNDEGFDHYFENLRRAMAPHI